MNKGTNKERSELDVIPSNEAQERLGQVWRVGNLLWRLGTKTIVPRWIKHVGDGDRQLGIGCDEVDVG